MGINFTPDEVIFIYRLLKSELRKSTPFKNNIPSALQGKDTVMLEATLEKLESAYPALKALER